MPLVEAPIREVLVSYYGRRAKSYAEKMIWGRQPGGTGVPPVNTCKMPVSQFLCDRSEQRPNLLAQFRTRGMAVLGYGVIYGGVEHLFFGSFEPQRAAAVAWMFTAIN